MFYDDNVIRKIFRSEDFGYETDQTPETAERDFYVGALTQEIRKVIDEKTADRIDVLTFQTITVSSEIAFRQGVRFAISFMVQAMIPQMPTYADKTEWRESVKETMEG